MRKFEINSWGYYETFIHKNQKETLGDWGYFYKVGNDWRSRMSGMSFNITGASFYLKLKEYLDNEFNKFQRKQKIININEKCQDLNQIKNTLSD